MKRIMIVLLVCTLLLTTGCGAAPAETQPSETAAPETTEAPTTEATEPETTEPETVPVPDTVPAVVQVDKTPAVLTLLNAGDKAQVVGEYDEEYVVIKTESGYGLVEKGLLRLEGQEAYEAWEGYAYPNAELYASYQLTGEPVQTLGLNTKIQVLEELPYCYVVTVEGAAGFIAKAQVSKSYIRYSGGGGGGGGGGQDGGDITMGWHGSVELLSAVTQSGEVTGEATVLADGTQVILGFYDREDVAQVVAEESFAPVWEGYHTVYLGELFAYVPMNLVRLESESAYESWEAYAGYGAMLMGNHLLLGDPVQQLTVNTKLTVLWDTGDCLVVLCGETVGYVDSAKVSPNRYSTGGGGGGGGGDWTPPAM